MGTFCFSLPTEVLHSKDGQYFYTAVRHELNLLPESSSRFFEGLNVGNYASFYTFIYSDAFSYKITLAVDNPSRSVVEFFYNVSGESVCETVYESDDAMYVPLSYRLESGPYKLLRFCVFSWFLRSTFVEMPESTDNLELSRLLDSQYNLEIFEFNLHVFKQNESNIVPRIAQQYLGEVKTLLQPAYHGRRETCTIEQVLHWQNAFFSSRDASLLSAVHNIFVDSQAFNAFLCNVANGEEVIAPFMKEAKLSYGLRVNAFELKRFSIFNLFLLLQIRYTLHQYQRSLSDEYFSVGEGGAALVALQQKIMVDFQRLSEDLLQTNMSFSVLQVKRKRQMDMVSPSQKLLLDRPRH